MSSGLNRTLRSRNKRTMHHIEPFDNHNPAEHTLGMSYHIEEMENGRWFATSPAPQLHGIWGEGVTPQEALADLLSAVEGASQLKPLEHEQKH